jgi:hypothetical protein
MQGVISMRKKIRLLIIGIILTSLFTGCSSGSYISIGSVQKDTATSMSMSYSKFSGQRSTSLTVKKGEIIDVAINIVTKSGSINVAIDNESGESFYEGTDVPTSSFVVSLEKEGEYKLSVNAKSHKGSYEISWDKRESNKDKKE